MGTVPISLNGFPAISNVEADPREEVNVVGTSAWVVGPYLKLIGEYYQSLENPKPVKLTEFGRGKPSGEHDRLPAWRSLNRLHGRFAICEISIAALVLSADAVTTGIDPPSPWLE
jgi:hypothetical protein